MIRAHVTSVSPLQVKPKGALTGQPVQRIHAHVTTTGWVIGDPVDIEIVEGQITVVGRSVSV